MASAQSPSEQMSSPAADSEDVSESSRDIGTDNEDDSNLDGDGTSSSTTSTTDLMESLVRVTLAGLGGSIVGLSQEKRLESMRVVAGAAATAAARRRRSAPASQAAMMNLPLTWSISCMAFCAIIETSRRASPSTAIWQVWDSSSSSSSANNQNDSKAKFRKSAMTVADYTIGGAIGGLAGTLGRRTQLRKRLPSAMLRGSQTFFGVVPGIALGLAAGVLQASTDMGLEYAEEQRAAQENPASTG